MKGFLIAAVMLCSCSKYRDYANEAIYRWCSPEYHQLVIAAINACTAAAGNEGSSLEKDECFAYTAVTFCPRYQREIGTNMR